MRFNAHYAAFGRFFYACCGIVLLGGCAGYGEMVKEYNPGTVQVTWIQQKPFKCAEAKNPLGCAHITRDNKTCIIEMDADAPDFVVAHEFKHCFGFVHRK